MVNDQYLQVLMEIDNLLRIRSFLTEQPKFSRMADRLKEGNSIPRTIISQSVFNAVCNKFSISQKEKVYYAEKIFS